MLPVSQDHLIANFFNHRLSLSPCLWGKLMTDYNNIFDMLTVMCDATLLIADGNWGDANVSEYVRSRIPACQHVEGFRDILNPVIEKRKKATVNEESSEDRIDVAYRLFQARDKKSLCDLRGQIHIELQTVHGNIYELSLNAKAAEILEKVDEYNRLQKDISANHATKQDLEKIDGLLVKLINLLN